MIGSIVHTRIQHSAFASFGRHDLRKFLSAWAEDAVFIYPGTSSFAGRFEGKKAIEAWFQRYMERFPRIEFTLKNVCVKNAFGVLSNVVTTEWDVAVTNREGEDFVYGGVTMVHLAGAKATLVKDYIFDTSVLKRALHEDAREAARPVAAPGTS